MDGLRWLLLLFGVLVIAGVYFYSRRERDRTERPGRNRGKRVEPSLDAAPLPESDEATFDADAGDGADEADEADERRGRHASRRS